MDPKEKDFNPSYLKKYSFDDRIKNELDKCILVCANCHREIHFEIRENKKEDISPLVVGPPGIEPGIEA